VIETRIEWAAVTYRADKAAVMVAAIAHEIMSKFFSLSRVSDRRKSHCIGRAQTAWTTYQSD
jgi:HD superfamily phosphohydrolase YqeK